MKNKNTEQIYEWLESFDFNELDKNQKNLVLQNLSEKEYNDLSKTVRNLQNEPKLEIQHTPPLRLTRKKQSAIQRFIQLKMPVYQAAAILFVALLFSGLIQNRAAKPAIKNSSYDYSAEYSKSIKEDSIAAIFITGMYR